MKQRLAPISYSIKRQRGKTQRYFLYFFIILSVTGLLCFCTWFQDAFTIRRVEKIGQQPPKIFCWVPTTPENHYKKAVHVKLTWGGRCDGLFFVSTEEDPYLPAIKLPSVPYEGREYLWEKTKGTLEYLYANQLQNYDWFLKADDDTYIIMNNLRKLVETYSPNSPIYLGCRYKPYVEQGYMSGGAGYVLSREALRRFVEIGIPSKGCEANNTVPEDVALGQCMETVGVVPTDSRDSEGRHRFLPFHAEYYFSPQGARNKPSWYWEFLYYPQTLVSEIFYENLRFQEENLLVTFQGSLLLLGYCDLFSLCLVYGSSGSKRPSHWSLELIAIAVNFTPNQKAALIMTITCFACIDAHDGLLDLQLTTLIKIVLVIVASHCNEKD